MPFKAISSINIYKIRTLAISVILKEMNRIATKISLIKFHDNEKTNHSFLFDEGIYICA